MKRLKEIRKEKKISQKEFATYMNVAQNTVSRWENGERSMDPEALTKAAAYFGVSVDYLLGNKAIRFSEREMNAAESKLMMEFSKLNDFGKKEAIKRVEELTHISTYVNIDLPIAAHNDNPIDDKELELMRQDLEDL